MAQQIARSCLTVSERVIQRLPCPSSDEVEQTVERTHRYGVPLNRARLCTQEESASLQAAADAEANDLKRKKSKTAQVCPCRL